MPTAHELLGEAYRANGDLDRAEQHLRRCVATSPDRSGTTGLPDLTLAELLVEHGTPAGLREPRGRWTPPIWLQWLAFHTDATILAELRRLPTP